MTTTSTDITAQVTIALAEHAAGHFPIHPSNERLDMTTTSTDITAQVTIALAEHADTYDIPAIVAAIIDQHGRVDIDDIESADFWAIVEAHEA